MQVIEDFFLEIDRLWPQQVAQGRKVQLSIIGCGALMLQARYERRQERRRVWARRRNFCKL